jgi:antitoxin (DNA-binding transcriptional repressor) of toxin-antitoxin stability system
MKEINITALREDLPAYVARAARGERIRVTSRGKVVAELGPPGATSDAVQQARARLRGSITRYDQPLDPVIDQREWEAER